MQALFKQQAEWLKSWQEQQQKLTKQYASWGEYLIPAVLGVAVDIAGRKRAEEALRESERRLSTLMANLLGMAYRCRNDQDWTMEFVSGGCRALTGHPPEDLIGNRKIAYANIIHPEDREDVRQQIEVALQEKGPFQVEYRIRTSSGEVRWVLEQGQGVLAEDGELLALEGFITDITERKKAEEAPTG